MTSQAADALTANQLGRILHAQGKLDEAQEWFSRSLNQHPKSAEAWNNLGIIYQQKRIYGAALQHYRKSIALQPDFAATWSNLGALADELGRFNDAVKFYERAVRLAPDLLPLRHNLAGIYRELQQWEKSFEAYEKALTLDPTNEQTHCAYIYARDLDPRTTWQDSLAHKRTWWRTHKRKPQTQWPNSTCPYRKLKLGYVSGDYSCHSAAFAFCILLFGHDRTHFEVTAYATGAREDVATEKFKASVDRWRRVVGQSDEQLATLIRQDGIDILIDLSGFTSGNRLKMFTMRPAPIQVHAVGYLTGTGLPDIGHILLDKVLGEDPRHYVEHVVKLPSLFHYRAPEAPDVVSLPALHNGNITFGYLGRWSKVTAETASLWSEILRRAPNARLYLKDRAFVDEAQRRKALDRLGAVSENRVTFATTTGHYDHLSAHGNVDIGLDPIQNNGGVSTLDALHMGVPVVTRPTERSHGKVGASIMTTLGLTGFIAGDYVETALRMAARVKDLREIRSGMRARMRATTIGNAPLYVAHVERAYRQMWADHCARFDNVRIHKQM